MSAVYNSDLADKISAKAENFRETRLEDNEDVRRIPGVDNAWIVNRMQQNLFRTGVIMNELTYDQLQDESWPNDSAIRNSSALVLMFLALRPRGHDRRTADQMFFRWLIGVKKIPPEFAHTIVFAISEKAEQRSVWHAAEDFQGSFLS